MSKLYARTYRRRRTRFGSGDCLGRPSFWTRSTDPWFEGNLQLISSVFVVLFIQAWSYFPLPSNISWSLATFYHSVMICKELNILPLFLIYSFETQLLWLKNRILISQKELYDECARIENGKITNYTDYLHKIDDQFAVSICSIDGQKIGLGPHNKMFTMQSLIVRVSNIIFRKWNWKWILLLDTLLIAPFIYALCMEEHGKDFINSVVGQETSGGQYNKISLDFKRRPHNPMINTGQVFTDR